MNAPLLERYRERIAGVLTCYDRIVITGTLPGARYAAGMTSYLNAKHIRIFDYPRFAEALRERIRENAEALATSAGVSIQHIAKAHIRKESVVAEVIKTRGDHPGLVHVISAMEACSSYKAWHDKRTHQTFLRPTPGKCLHYYFYFIDAELGLVYLPHLSVSSITRYLKRLRDFGLIKKVVGTYRYCLTRICRHAIGAACRISEHIVIPALAA